MEPTSTVPAPTPHKRSRRSRIVRWLALGLLGCGVATAAFFAIQASRPDPADGVPVAATAVTLRDNQFLPPVIRVERGATVTWTWDDGGEEHNVVGPGWNSGTRTAGQYQQTFAQPGSYRYSCTLHSNMNGRIDVVAVG